MARRKIAAEFTAEQLADIAVCLDWALDLNLGYGMVPQPVEQLRINHRRATLAKVNALCEQFEESNNG